MGIGLARDLAYALDPAAFSRAAGIVPDPWQENVLRSNARRLLILASRQSGKSTTVATLAAHEAIYTPGSLTLCVAPTLRQSGELFRKVLATYRAAGRPVDAEAESRLSLELENGSRVVALPGREGSIRSFSSVNLLLLDEAARIPDDLLAAVRPMLAVSQGRLVALTTAWGKRGWFYGAWMGSEAYERYKVPATDVPRIPAEFLREEERALGPLFFQSEYMCEFVDASGALFSMAEVEASIKEYPTWQLSRFM